MIIRTNLVPKGYDAWTLFPFILIRPGKDTDWLIVHEEEHLRQQRWTILLPVIGLGIWYALYQVPALKWKWELEPHRAELAAGRDLTRVARSLVRYRKNATEKDAIDALLV